MTFGQSYLTNLKGKYLSRTTASSLFKAKLGHEKMILNTGYLVTEVLDKQKHLFRKLM